MGSLSSCKAQAGKSSVKSPQPLVVRSLWQTVYLHAASLSVLTLAVYIECESFLTDTVGDGED